MPELDLNAHRTLVQSILAGKLTGTPVPKMELIETHISSVIVSDEFVYKIKKPINLGFLDFSTLQKRQFFCDEEIRLNQRLSADIYIDVIPIYGSCEQPDYQAQGDVLDYLVHMKPFAQQEQLDRLLEQGALGDTHMSEFATYIAAFHEGAAKAPVDSHYGEPGTLMKPVRENFTQIREHCNDDAVLNRLEPLQQWSEAFFAQHQQEFLSRKQQGFIRECHGDLHLRNLAWVNDHPLAFDCIEFDADLYWIDVINDIAFLIMDLHDRKQGVLAQAFLNQYLERSGDYAGLALLQFYMLYRAMVRVKIESITESQVGISKRAKQQARQSLLQYLSLAEQLCEIQTGGLLLMHGPSASGKSTLSKSLSACLPAIVLRSDVERKRLFGLSAEQSAASDYAEGIYSAEATHRTYQRLTELAATVLACGYNVIVDATFNQADQRALFYSLAQQKRLPYLILDLKVPEEILLQRIRARNNDVSDADSQVLSKQLASWKELELAEEKYTLVVYAGQDVDINKLCHQVERFLIQSQVH